MNKELEELKNDLDFRTNIFRIENELKREERDVSYIWHRVQDICGVDKEWNEVMGNLDYDETFVVIAECRPLGSAGIGFEYLNYFGLSKRYLEGLPLKKETKDKFIAGFLSEELSAIIYAETAEIEDVKYFYEDEILAWDDEFGFLNNLKDLLKNVDFDDSINDLEDLEDIFRESNESFMDCFEVIPNVVDLSIDDLDENYTNTLDVLKPKKEKGKTKK